MDTVAESRQVPLEVCPGALLAGRYRVQRVLGAGGMGVVVAAEHVQLAEPVALKFLLPGVERDPEAKPRFAREAWTTARIKSEHVVRVIDVGELPNGTVFLVMEYLDGMDLASLLRVQGRLPVVQAVQFMLEACEGIAEAHALGIVHRDLKPSNVFCARRSDGVIAIKILDFGMSKLMWRTGVGFSHSITGSSSILGSPLYMSPEQMNSSKSIDARTDIWSLGVILYELLVGSCPFVAETFPELAVKVAIGAAPSLRASRDEVPRGLERIVSRCLEKDRNRRFDDVAQLAQALAEYASPSAVVHAERAARVLRVHAAVVPEPAVQARPASAHASTPPGASRRRVFAVRAGLLAAGIALVAGITALGGARVLPGSNHVSGRPESATNADAPKAVIVVPERLVDTVVPVLGLPNAVTAPARARDEPVVEFQAPEQSQRPGVPAAQRKPRVQHVANAAAAQQPEARPVNLAQLELDELGGRK